MSNHPRRSRHSQKVVTYSTDRGETLNICTTCAQVLRRENTWPKGRTGCEYVNVDYGLHDGQCDLTQ